MLRLLLTGFVLFLLPGVIVLIVILIVKKNKKKNSPPEEEAAGGQKSGRPELNYPEAGNRSASGNAVQAQDSLHRQDSRRERTMMLTYTTLILKDKDRPIRTYKADLFQPVYIGRDRNNRIRLSDPSVSRRHLKVYRSGGLVYAENLSRANGTKLNGRYLTEPKEIVSGNLLELGAAKLLVEID